MAQTKWHGDHVAFVFLLTAICALVLGLSGCKQKIDIPGKAHKVEFEWHILDEQTLREFYMQQEGAAPLGEHDKIEGFAGVLPDGTRVIVTERPTRLDDRATCTLGHEVLHLIQPNYH